MKVITGIRRCGKSYLLRSLFKNYLLSQGVPENHILSFELDLTRDILYRNSLELSAHIREIAEHSPEPFYLFVDEIRVHPLIFAEYYSAVDGDKEDAFENYAFYGGMPLILSRPADAAKMNYLISLFSEVYLKDIVDERRLPFYGMQTLGQRKKLF